MSEENKTQVASIFGEALLELVIKNREIGRETLAMLIRDRAEKEQDEDKILVYWQACRALLGTA